MIAVGVLLLVGFFVIAGVIVQRLRHSDNGTAKEIQLALPSGATIKNSYALDGNLALQLDLPGRKQQIMIVDPDNGKILKIIR